MELFSYLTQEQTVTPNFSANPLASFLSNDQAGLSNSASSLTTTAVPAGANSEGVASEVSFSGVLQGYAPGQSPDSATSTASVPIPLTGDATTAGVLFESTASDSIMSADFSGLTGLTTPPGGNELPADLIEVASLESTGPDNSADANIILENLQSGEPDTTSIDFTLAISPNSVTPAVVQGASVFQTSAIPGQAPSAMAAVNLRSSRGDVSTPNLLTSATAREGLAQVQAQLPAMHPSNNVTAQLQSEPLPPSMAMQNMLKQQMMSSTRSQASTLPGIGGLSGMESVAGDEAYILQPGHALLSSASADRPTTLQGTPMLSTIPRAIGTPDWNQGLGQRMLMMVDNGLNQAELRLDPPQLGSIHVRISMSDDQAQLFFQAAHPAARDALESAMPRLREMFAEQGLQLDNADVGGQSQQSASDKSEQGSDLQDTTSLSDGQERNSDALENSRGAASGMETRGLIDEFV